MPIDSPQFNKRAKYTHWAPKPDSFEPSPTREMLLIWRDRFTAKNRLLRAPYEVGSQARRQLPQTQIQTFFLIPSAQAERSSKK